MALQSNHGDPEHLWNQLGTGYTMNGFRKAVQADMKGGGVTTTPNAEKPTTGGHRGHSEALFGAGNNP